MSLETTPDKQTEEPGQGLISLEGAIDRDLERVRHAIFDYLVGFGGLATQVARHLLLSPGKLLRPKLCLASAYATTGSAASERTVQAAAVVELLHVGSLYHDDVIDEADTRRGLSSANREWSNSVAVLGGDLLFAGSASIAADLGQYESQVGAAALHLLCLGELEEVRCLFDRSRRVSDYFFAICGKTAALFEAACVLGGLEAGSDRIPALARFGRLLGMSFQIVDDVVDFGGTASTGKSPGADWRAGVYTLPVLLSGTDELHAAGLFDVDDLDAVREALESAGGLGRSLWYADEFAMAAIRCVEGLVAPDVLLSLVDEVMAPVVGWSRREAPPDSRVFRGTLEWIREQRGVLPAKSLDPRASAIRPLED